MREAHFSLQRYGNLHRYVWQVFPYFLFLLLSFHSQAQNGCGALTAVWQNFEPCKYRLVIQNGSECTPSLTIRVNSGTLASWSANTSGGWTAVQVNPTDILLTHNGPFVPIGQSIPIGVNLSPAVNVSVTLLWDFTCGLGESCFSDATLDACPDPLNASVIGVKYRECNGAAYTNQATVPDWPIQLLTLDGQVVAEEITTSDGSYGFYDLPYGQYLVKEATKPGWTANVPPSGQTFFELDPSEQITVNFGNCPSCSCDSIQLNVVPVSNNIDVCCYRATVTNKSAYCFKDFIITVDPGLFITTYTATGGWTVTPIGTTGLQVKPATGTYIPIGSSIPVNFCVAGGTVHNMTIQSSYTTSSMSVLCSKDLSFACGNQACVCKPSNGILISNTGVTYQVPCNNQQPLPVMPCATAPVTISGDFGCVDATGAPCTPPSPIDWKLLGPNGAVITSGAITTGTPWTLPFATSDLANSGMYTLYMTTLCPGQTDSCKCVSKWFQECASACTCGPSPFTMEFRYGGAQNVPVQCEETLQVTTGSAFYPKFQCQGMCSNTYLDWTLTGPGGYLQSMTNVTTTGPNYDFTIPQLLPTNFPAPGLYTLTMVGHCGTDICTCKVYFCLPPDPPFLNDTSVCRTNPTAYIPVLDCPTGCTITEVKWFLKKCTAATFPATPYQVSTGPGCDDLLLLPYQYPSEQCVQVYAVVTLGGDCCVNAYTTNTALINLCNPVSCSINNPNPAGGYCQSGSPLPLTVVPSGVNCPVSFAWYFKGILVGSSATYQPPQLVFEGGPNDCYTDHVFTCIVTGLCGPSTCTSSIRVYNDNAPLGTLTMVPFEQQPFCPGEDARLVYDPKCAGEPEKWTWYSTTVDPPALSDYQPISTAGMMNGVYYTNKLFQTTWFMVEKKNGACPADQIPLRIEVKPSIQINNFTVTPDPCVDFPVTLSVDFTPAVHPGPTGCSYVVEWYKDGDLVHMSTSGGSPVSWTMTGTGTAAGVYYAIVKDDCCPQAEKTWPIILNPSCEPVVLGPCFKCDTTTPVDLTVEMVLPPQDPCPAGVVCTYQWYKKDFSNPLNPVWILLPGETGSILTITQGGIFKVITTCDYGFGPCVKEAEHTVVQCISTGNGCVPLASPEVVIPSGFSVQIIPNPTSSFVQVQCTDNLKKGRIEILDLRGVVLQSVLIESGQKTKQIQLSQAPPGMYIVRVYEQDLPLWSGKLIRSE